MRIDSISRKNLFITNPFYFLDLLINFVDKVIQLKRKIEESSVLQNPEIKNGFKALQYDFYHYKLYTITIY